MISLFRLILETVLFPSDTSSGLILIAEPEPSSEQDRKTTGEYYVPKDLFPPVCEARSIPGGDDLVSALRAITSQIRPSRLFMFPPFLSPRFVPEGLRTEYPGLSLEEIALQVVVDTLAPGSLVGVLLPTMFFSGERPRAFRERLFREANPCLVITHDHSWREFGVHAAFRMNSLVIEIGQQGQSILRFFKCPEAVDAKQQREIISDLQRLLRQGGGRTRYGYILRNGLPPGAALLHDMYHPDLVSRQQEISHFGDVRPLGELVYTHRGLHKARNASLLLEGNCEKGVPVIEARDIRADGSIAFEEPRCRAQIPTDRLLKAGDLCLRAIIGNTQRLYVAQIEEHMLPLVALDTVLILRPKPSTTSECRELLLAYLRSGIAAEFLRARGVSFQIFAKAILELPVPVPDKPLSLAIRSLNEAAEQFDSWKAEAEAARSSLFEFSSAKDARLQLLAIGRLARRRREAAALVDDFRHRVRTQFPHPIAYRWRTIEFSRPDLEGYVQLLECAEITVCYLACMAILLARTVEGARIGWVHEMAKRISGSSSKGTNMGDWIAILREVRDSKAFRNVPDFVPFGEVLYFLMDEEADRALQSLAVHRNDQAHGRGPKGTQIKPAFTECLPDLEVLLQVVEFLSEYRLRHVESTQRDSMRRITHYEFRDLMGDHALVPLDHGETEMLELEAQSLYLVDRARGMHLLRPLLTRRECPQCGRWATFYLDSWEKDNDCCILKSMERGHTVRDIEISWAFRQIGLLRSSDLDQSDDPQKRLMRRNRY